MKIWTADRLAVSRAGHDSGTLYVILEEDGDYFLLSDGARRTLEKPKKKKKKHAQVIRHLPEEVLEQMKEISLDAHVRKILKKYEEFQNSRRSGYDRTDTADGAPDVRNSQDGYSDSEGDVRKDCFR